MAAARTGSTKARFVNERQLFHGTNPEIVEAICKQNFDWRLHGKNATVYGEGSYFALNSSYSDRYAKEDSKGSKFMFVAKVLVGSYTTGHSSYRRPPSKEPSNPASDLYDSCVDDRSFPTIFVVFDTDQFYPEYIIEYSTTRDGHQQPAGPVARALAPRPRLLPAAMGVAATAHYNASSLSTSYQTTTSSSVLSPVQAPYSSSLLSLGGYTSTSSTTYNSPSANYYHDSPIAGVTPFTSSNVLSSVQAPYSSSLLSLGGYTSTSSTTYNSPSANYYHDSPIAGVTPFTSSNVLSSVQAPYSSSLLGLGGFYTSTSSTTYNSPSANYYHGSPIAGVTPFTSSSVLSSVQAPYASSSLGLGGFYTSTSSTTYNPSSANYYHLPTAGESPFTSASSHYQYPPTASTTTSYAYSGASGNQSVSPSSSWSSSPAYKPEQPRDSSKDKCVVYLYFFCISMNFFVVMYAIFFTH